jgi:histidinol dehydrogenase
MTLQASPIRLSTQQPDFEACFETLRTSLSPNEPAIDAQVAQVLEAVRTQGDAAVLAYTARFDGVHASAVKDLEIATCDLQAAFENLPKPEREALETAAARIRRYHEAQKAACGLDWQVQDPDGSVLGQRVTPIHRVGIYVPGGKASYPSSVLMNAIPAQVAGVRDIVMVTPTPQGQRHPLVLAAAYLGGVTRVFTVGGAQAVGALAYGTDSIPGVDKIVGPGNAYVASAKRQVFGQVGIDMVAGPSEIVILADGKTPPDWVAMDLFSQAEHDELAQSILLCPDEAYLDKVQASLTRLLDRMPRAATIAASLNGRGALIHTQSFEEACALSNRLAPEHLELSCNNPRQWLPLIHHAGAIFLGKYSSESLGDYCAGPNHVLPTSGTARFSSPLSVMDFQKRSSLIEISSVGAQTLGRVALTLAYGEGLQAHAMSAQMRLL